MDEPPTLHHTGDPLAPPQQLTHQPPDAPPAFTPPRKRDLTTKQRRAARFDQPPGKAAPSILPVSPPSRSDHLRVALSCDPHAHFLDKLITRDIRHITSALKRDPNADVTARAATLFPLSQLSDRLGPIRSKWISALPPESMSGNANSPLVHIISHALQCTDTALATDVARGPPPPPVPAQFPKRAL